MSMYQLWLMRLLITTCCALVVVMAPPALLAQKVCTRNDTPRLTANEVAILAHKYWKCDDLVTAVAVAGAESGFGYKCEQDDPDGSIDYGLWQFNSFHVHNQTTCADGSLADEVPAHAAEHFACEVNQKGFNVSLAYECRNGGMVGSFDCDKRLPTAPANWRTAFAQAQVAVQQFAAECSCQPALDFNVYVSSSTFVCPPIPPPNTGGGLNGLIITSGDPNDKAGSQGAGTQQYISGATPLRYTVLFANQSTATAPAQDVVITDQLDMVNDDLSTLSLGPIAFGNQLVSPPAGLPNFTSTMDLRPANNLLVQVNAHLNVATGLLTWRFISLDPTTHQPPTDPSAGFLPPGGEGSVFFTVMPKQGLSTNTQIQNQATIIFDVNPPMSTQTWLNTLDNDKPTSHTLPLPTVESSASSLSDLGFQ